MDLHNANQRYGMCVCVCVRATNRSTPCHWYYNSKALNENKSARTKRNELNGNLIRMFWEWGRGRGQCADRINNNTCVINQLDRYKIWSKLFRIFKLYVGIRKYFAIYYYLPASAGMSRWHDHCDFLLLPSLSLHHCICDCWCRSHINWIRMLLKVSFVDAIGIA